MKKNRAFSTPELMVSGGIMLAVTVLSFDVMLTGAKLSTAGVAASSHESEARNGVDIIQRDIAESDGVKSKLNDTGGTKAKNNKTLILKKSIYDANGDVVVGKCSYVVYSVQKVDGKDCLVRYTGIQVGTNPFTLVKDRSIISDLVSIKIITMRSSTISPFLGIYTLPGPTTSGTPSGNKIRLRGATIPEANVSASECSATADGGAINTALCNLTSKVLCVGNTVSLKLGIATKPADFLFETDMTNAITADYDSDASRVAIAITTEGRHGQPDNTIPVGGNLKNAQ
ncbi:MAG: hypothetical protein JSS71_01555 [Armatimonadetes bacterium]|nr:hypothetical protein [Armatimonadota bacterium]MBX3108971.1 hypothetical protein [Fimbriimonadaceae bacterium]